MKTAATAIEKRPSPITIGAVKAAPAAWSTMFFSRSTAYRAMFSMRPESIALMGVGASACASGNQVCMGATPALVPYPIKIKTKASLRVVGSSVGATR